MTLKRRDAASPSKTAAASPRWLKIAASLAAMASFVAIAAVVGRVALNAPEQEAPTAIPTDPETEIISNQGENTMIARKMATLVGAAMVSVAVPAETIESEPTFVFLRPETSSFWNTATNNTMTVPLDFPSGATKATLSIRGLDYVREYADITRLVGDEERKDFTFELPEPTSQEAENVYNLTLSFDDAALTTRTAKLGLIQGLSPDAEGTTRCLAPETSRVWQKVKGRAVMPIPFGTDKLSVNGIEVDSDELARTKDGVIMQGWYAIGGLDAGTDASLELVANGVTYAASLIGGPGGLMLIIK